MTPVSWGRLFVFSGFFSSTIGGGGETAPSSIGGGGGESIAWPEISGVVVGDGVGVVGVAVGSGWPTIGASPVSG